MIWKDPEDLLLHILQQFQPKSTVWKETRGSRRRGMESNSGSDQSNQVWKQPKRQRVKQNLFEPFPNNQCQPTSLCSQSKIVQNALNTPLPTNNHWMVRLKKVWMRKICYWWQPFQKLRYIWVSDPKTKWCKTQKQFFKTE